MMKRDGPHPLWLHLNGGAAFAAAAVEGDDMIKTSLAMMQKAMDGVQAYQNSSIEPFHREMECVFEINGTRVLTGKGWTGKAPILIVPSLINSWRILDIEKDHSFMAYLLDRGFTPMVIEWASPNTNISLDDYITKHLKPIVDELDIDTMIGYCMGGTMIAALCSVYPSLKTKKAVLIAPPWNFDYQTPDQIMRLQSLAMQTYAMGDNVPRDYIQSLFWAVDPLQVFKKFQKFPKVGNPDRFVRVEDWLNEGHGVSTSVIQTCLFDWYRDNTIVEGRWSVDGHIVDDKHLPTETLIVAGKDDNLVPMASIEPLIENRSLVTVKTGHIGLMGSDKSIKGAWDPIVKFLLK